MFDFIGEHTLYYYSLITWVIIAVIIFIILVSFKNLKTYGRHVPKKGVLLNNRLGWFLMEIPTLILMPYFIYSGTKTINTVIFCFLGLYMVHYFNRTIIFPFRLKFKKNKIPLHIVFSAAFFNLINTFFLGYYFGNIKIYQENWFTTPYFIIGIIIFFIGMSINIKSDNILINLRKNNNEEYSIPRGGLFKYISCPNHFGEIIEWFGFAILSWSFASFSFFIWTACNLIPRSIKHHNWYKNKFKKYPKERKAVIPYLL